MYTKIHDVIIIGTGLSGLAVGHFLRKQAPHLDTLLIDKSQRVGGAIMSHHENGFRAEYGAHGYLDNVAESREMLAGLFTDSQIQKAPLKKFVRYLCLGQRLQVVPQSPAKIIKSTIMPLRHKLRVLADLWKKPFKEEQTVAAWIAHRFGQGMLPFADAVFTGTYAGDIRLLSFDAVMPGARKLELESGSIIRGVLKLRKDKKQGLHMPSMVSFANGMEELVLTLAKDKTVLLDTPVTGLKKNHDIWEIQTTTGDLQARQVVVALHINRALTLLKSISTPPTPAVPEARLVNVVMGFDHTANIPFGFGYLAPEQENRFAMGALFSSHMFPGRAPVDHSLVEVLVGGRRHPERVDMEDHDLINKSYQDIKELIDLPHPPVYTKVLRPKVGIPQLEIGHRRLQEWRDSLEVNNKGLKIIGFGWDGIGINDMIKQAKHISSALAEGVGEPLSPPQVRAVYV